MTRGRIRRRPGQPDRPRLKIQHASDLLAMIPYLLGFHPKESVVAVLMRRAEVVVSIRADLCCADVEPAELARGFAEGLESLAGRQRATGVILVGYSLDPHLAEHWLAELTGALGWLEVIDAYRADGERWWSLTCGGPCCPAEGTPYEVAGSRCAAEAVYAGLVAEPDRESLEASVLGPPEAEWDDLLDRAVTILQACPELADPAAAEAAVEGAVRSVLLTLPVADLAPLECLRLALLVQHTAARDRACAMIEFEDADDHARLWHWVVAAVPPELASAPLALLGIASWIGGGGALLNICIDRLARLDPDYSIRSVLTGLVGVNPDYWSLVGPDLRKTAGVRGGGSRVRAWSRLKAG